MKLEELMTVATFSEAAPADTLRQRLEAARIPAQLFDEGMTQRIWWLVPRPKAHMRVRVEKERFEEAEALVRRWNEEDGALKDAVVCPECGASRVEYPQYSRRTLMTFFFGIANLFGYLPRLYFCPVCQYTWSPEPPKPEPELDVLNWAVKRPRKATAPAARSRR